MHPHTHTAAHIADTLKTQLSISDRYYAVTVHNLYNLRYMYIKKKKKVENMTIKNASRNQIKLIKLLILTLHLQLLKGHSLYILEAMTQV